MLSRLNPLTTLAACGAAATFTVAASNWPVSVAVAVAALGAGVGAGVLRRVLAASAVILLPLWFSLLVLHGLFFPEGRTVLAGWGPARITVEGLAFALEMGTRTTGCVLVLLLFSFVVNVPDLVATMTTRRIPPQFGYVLASTLTLAPAITEQLARIRQAQEARGLVLGGSLVQRLAAARLQMVPLVLALIQDAAERAHALDARGFNSPGPHSTYREVADTRGQRTFRRAVLGLAAAAVILRLSASWFGVPVLPSPLAGNE
ncbi:energy-coupling factor transporter transmembrane component T [Arthrobacter sp.]|uniref:energy-coupling factor transporter transmembrane component T n=1 Tax=Arthrobacter sp. TaxID=1667 RepID=UPI002811B9AC|nr:energy-coupling factor transporter transmembrane component T [Arthrobacter sp.]